MKGWNHLVKVLKNPEKTVRIAVVGKYVDLKESYKSLHESLVHGGVASGLFFASTAACIWVLQLGWALAAAGIVFLFVGVVWRVASRNAAPSFSEPSGHKSSGFIWPGLALLAAPFANAFVLMPVLRQSMH